MDKVGDTEIETGTYNVEATTDSKYQDYVLESIIPTEADISHGEAPFDKDGNAPFKIKVTPRAGKLPPYGNLYFKLTSTYSGDEDVSFDGTVVKDGETNKFKAKPEGMPYVAGMRGDGLGVAQAVANITSSDVTLEVGVFGYNASNSAIINFIKSITVEYAWVNEKV